MSADLRARIAAALMARIKAAIIINPVYSPGVVGQPFAATEYDLADVALAEVQAELDAKDTEIEQLRTALERDLVEANEDLRQATAIQECTERDFARLRQGLAERDRLRAAVERVRDELAGILREAKQALTEAHPAGTSRSRADGMARAAHRALAALDQAPAPEQDGGGR